MRLEAADAVRHALAVLFAFEGRIVPYAAYLQHELQTYPLQTVPAPADGLLETILAIVAQADVTAVQRLAAAVFRRAREAGHGDVIDDWGEDVDWMLNYAPD